MRSFLRISAVILAVLSVCHALRAGDKDSGKGTETLLDTLFWAPEIVVEGVRVTPDDLVLDCSGFIGLIEVGKDRDVMADAAALLSRTVGVRIRQYGGLGSFATMSIRGSSSTQVQVYMDGIPLNDAYTGMTNLADLELGDIRRIEVYRGFSPARFGSSSIGGTVNLVPGSDDRQEAAGRSPGISARAAAGSFDTERYSMSLKAAGGIARLVLFGGYTRSAGDFSFFDDNATPENPYDDGVSLRENNDFTRSNYTARLNLTLPGFRRFSLNHTGTSREGGVPGTGANQSTEARLARRRRITYLKAEPARLMSGLVQTELSTFYSWTAESFNDPGGDIDLAVQATDNRITSYGGNLRVRTYWPWLPLSTEILAEGKKERFHPERHLPSYNEGPDRLRSTLSASVSGDLALFSDRAIVTGTHRSEWYVSEFYDEPALPWLPPTPQGRKSGAEHRPGAGLRIQPAPFVTIKGNWGLYYRIPTFFEMFGNQGSVTGDSGLEPESGHNRDIGIVLSADRFWGIGRPYIEAIYLYSEIDDLILFFPNSQSTIKPENIGSARIRGIELSASGSFGKRISISGNYCWLESTDTGPIPYYCGNDLPSRPAHEAGLSLEYKTVRWGAAYELHHIGSNYLDRANMKKVKGRSIHGISLVLMPFGENVSLTIEGYNLGNDQTSDVSGFPLPGRSFYASIRLDI